MPKWKAGNAKERKTTKIKNTRQKGILCIINSLVVVIVIVAAVVIVVVSRSSCCCCCCCYCGGGGYSIYVLSIL